MELHYYLLTAFLCANTTEALFVFMGQPYANASGYGLDGEGMIFGKIGKWLAKRYFLFEQKYGDYLNPYKPFLCVICGNVWICTIASILLSSVCDMSLWQAITLPFASYFFQKILFYLDR